MAWQNGFRTSQHRAVQEAAGFRTPHKTRGFARCRAGAAVLALLCLTLAAPCAFADRAPQDLEAFGPIEPAKDQVISDYVPEEPAPDSSSSEPTDSSGSPPAADAPPPASDAVPPAAGTTHPLGPMLALKGGPALAEAREEAARKQALRDTEGDAQDKAPVNPAVDAERTVFSGGLAEEIAGVVALGALGSLAASFIFFMQARFRTNKY